MQARFAFLLELGFFLERLKLKRTIEICLTIALQPGATRTDNDYVKSSIWREISWSCLYAISSPPGQNVLVFIYMQNHRCKVAHAQKRAVTILLPLQCYVIHPLPLPKAALHILYLIITCYTIIINTTCLTKKIIHVTIARHALIKLHEKVTHAYIVSDWARSVYIEVHLFAHLLLTITHRSEMFWVYEEIHFTACNWKTTEFFIYAWR